jgi:thiamine biosynthesis protein ThiS
MSPAKDKHGNKKMTTETTTLTINGKVQEFPVGIPRTLAELLEQLNINQATVVAEIDGGIIERQSFAQTQLSAGQSIELVRFVGGG